MKFAQMATKKLQKLVNDPATSDEDKVAIQAILDKRQAATKAPADDGAALTISVAARTILSTLPNTFFFITFFSL